MAKQKRGKKEAAGKEEDIVEAVLAATKGRKEGTGSPRKLTERASSGGSEVGEENKVTPVIKSSPSSSSKKGKGKNVGNNVEDARPPPSPVPGPSGQAEQKTVKRKRTKKVPIPSPYNPKTQEEVKTEFEGMEIVTAMSADDLKLFLSRMEAEAPPDDIKRIPEREYMIDWEKVAFSCYGPEHCKMAWMYLSNQTRKYRIVHELVEEVKIKVKTNYRSYMKSIIEKSDDFPKKPYAMGAFQLYCKEYYDKLKSNQKGDAQPLRFFDVQSKCRESWAFLTDNEKKDYEVRVKVIQAEYHTQVKEFYAKYPLFAPGVGRLNKDGKKEKPITLKQAKINQKLHQELFNDAPSLPLTKFKLYITSKLNRHDPYPSQEELPALKKVYIDRWKSLGKKKKLKWIQSCVRKCERYVEEVKEYKKTNPGYILPLDFQISKLISKDEFKIWADANGSPPNPKSTIFDVFLEEFSQQEEALGMESQGEVRKAAMKKFKDLDSYHIAMYKTQFQLQKVTYKQQLFEYFNQLAVILRRIALECMHKLHRKILQDEKKKRQTEEDEEDLLVGSDAEAVPNVPIYKKELTDEQKKLIQQNADEEKNGESKTTNKRKRKKAASDDSDEDAANDSTINAKSKVAAINEAIRGIFDAKQHKGHKFSVYYFYAKYVSDKESWNRLITRFGLVETAARIVETFHRLDDTQKETFLNEAHDFYNRRYYGRKMFSHQDLYFPNLTYFPDEPKEPPKNAIRLYMDEMELKSKLDPGLEYVVWEKLDDKTQMYYMKKLYKITRDYVQQYEEFVKNTTPNDMVEYLIMKNEQWKKNLAHDGDDSNTKQDRILEVAVPVAAGDYVLPFSSATYAANLSDDETGSIIIEKDQQKKCQNFRYKKMPNTNNSSSCIANPFKKSNMLVKKLCQNSRNNTKHIDDADSDLPLSSDDEENDFKATGRSYLKFTKRKLERKLKEMAAYYYPLEDLYENKKEKTLKEAKNRFLERSKTVVWESHFHFSQRHIMRLSKSLSLKAVSSKGKNAANNRRMKSVKKSLLTLRPKKLSKHKRSRCNFNGATKKELSKHQQCHVPSESSKFKLTCPKCPFVTENREDLGYHARMGHPNTNRFKCHICEFSCKGRLRFEHHLLDHFGIYQFSCADCSYVSNSLNGITQHSKKFNHRQASGSGSECVTVDGPSPFRSTALALQQEKVTMKLERLKKGQKLDREKNKLQVSKPDKRIDISETVRLMQNAVVAPKYSRPSLKLVTSSTSPSKKKLTVVVDPDPAPTTSAVITADLSFADATLLEEQVSALDEEVSAEEADLIAVAQPFTEDDILEAERSLSPA